MYSVKNGCSEVVQKTSVVRGGTGGHALEERISATAGARRRAAGRPRRLDVERAAVIRLARPLRRRRPSAVFLSARGTSDNAALYGHYLFETVLGIPSGLASPSVVTIYRKV